MEEENWKVNVGFDIQEVTGALGGGVGRRQMAAC